MWSIFRVKKTRAVLINYTYGNDGVGWFFLSRIGTKLEMSNAIYDKLLDLKDKYDEQSLIVTSIAKIL